MAKKILLTLFSTVLIVSCSSQPIKRPIIAAPSFDFNLNRLKSEKELYVVFIKDKDGIPLSLVNITPDQLTALKYFENPLTIERNDCIRLTDKNETTVCNEQKWFDYGLEDKTKLTTRKQTTRVKSDPLLVVISAPFAIADLGVSTAFDIRLVAPLINS